MNRFRRMIGRVLWGVFFVAVVALVVVRVAGRGEKVPARSISDIQASEGVPVDVRTVRASTVREVEELVGDVEGEQQSTLRSSGAQKIADVSVTAGERVRRGQTLVRYDVEVSPDRVARLDQMKEAYDNARRQVDRLTPLYERGAVSESDLDAAKTQLAIAAANLRDSRLELEIVSPIDGVATLVAVRPGDSVADAAVLVQVATLDTVRVVADVAASTAALMRPGAPVYLTDGLPQGENAMAARGRISRVSLSADPDTRLFRVEAMLGNDDRRLLPGSVVRLAAVVAQSVDVPAVPLVAIVGQTEPERGASAEVYVVRDGVAHLTPVTIGLVGDDVFEAETGIVPGDQVVVLGANLLVDGAKTRLHRVDGELVGAGEEGTVQQ